MADSQRPPPLPWLYPYQEDGPRLSTIVMRPVVPISLVGSDVATPVFALVDSGCEHVLAAPWLAAAAGIDPKAGGRELNLGLGGDNVTVRFVDASLRLHAPGDDTDDLFIEWQAEVGFLKQWRPTWPMLVGQLGFLDRFTVSMNRTAQQIAIEEWDAFDNRFGITVASGPGRSPRH